MYNLLRRDIIEGALFPISDSFKSILRNSLFRMRSSIFSLDFAFVLKANVCILGRLFKS